MKTASKQPQEAPKPNQLSPWGRKMMLNKAKAMQDNKTRRLAEATSAIQQQAAAESWSQKMIEIKLQAAEDEIDEVCTYCDM